MQQMENCDGAIRITAFGVMLIALGLWEVVAPRRALWAN